MPECAATTPSSPFTTVAVAICLPSPRRVEIVSEYRDAAAAVCDGLRRKFAPGHDGRRIKSSSSYSLRERALSSRRGGTACKLHYESRDPFRLANLPLHRSVKTRQAKWLHADRGPFAGDRLPENSGRSRCEHDAIPEVAGRDPATVVRTVDNRQAVARSGTQPRPGFGDGRIAERRPQVRRLLEELVDLVRIDFFVESGVFHGRAHGISSLAAGHDIDIRGAQHALHEHFRF